MWVNFHYVFLLFGVITAAQALENGDSCLVGGKEGVCKTIEDCPIILQKFKEFREIPVRCSTNTEEYYFCCPPLEITTTTTTAATTTEDPLLLKIKSYQKCKEYAQYVYEDIDSPVALAESAKEKDDRCGHTVEELVTGGMDAKPMEFPHMAVLGYSDGLNPIKWACGGTLISDEFVLTAAHCISNKHGQLVRVRLGDLNIRRTDDDAKPQEFGIANITTQKFGKHKYNDVALIQLNGKVKLNPYVIPACLNWRDHITEKSAIATGWGLNHTDGNPTDILQKVTLELFPNDECNETFKPYVTKRVLPQGIIDNQICAGHRNMSKDTCSGDSGGPLQVFQKDNIYCMYSIIGITSFSVPGCGYIGTPGVYTKVSSYRKWIEDIVWK